MNVESFKKYVEAGGYKVQMVSIDHIEEIKSEIENLKAANKDVNDNIGKYLNKFNYKISESLRDAKSIIVIAVPQPMSRIYFTSGSKKHAVIMPPMYLFNSSIETEEKQKKIAGITSFLNEILHPDFKVKKINLPCKLIAVKSGLAQYGRNNVCYINGQSSFYWIGTYISDMPCPHDSWQEGSVMDRCSNCSLCLNNCPAGAIADDRFLLHANRCITLRNESSKDFPEWLNPRWHNSIIGCMRCQIVCPVNRNSITAINDIAEFDDEETKMIMDKIPLNELPEATFKKMQLINFIEDYGILARNLNVLINR